MFSIDDNVDRAEMYILGAIISTNGDALADLPLTGDDFGHPDRANLFDLMVKMHADRKPITLATLFDTAPDKLHVLAAKLSSHQGLAYAVGEHANIVRSHGVRRRLAFIGETFADLSHLETPEEIVEHARAAVDNVVGAPRSKVRFIGDVLPEMVDHLRAGDTFVPTLWQGLNAVIGGLRPGTMTVIAARPAVGKTVVAQGLATALAAHGNVAFASLEMSDVELVQRFVADLADLHIGKMKNGAMKDDDWARVDSHRDDIALRIAIDDRAGITPADIRSFVRSVAQRGPLAGVVVDYMQLLISKGKTPRHEMVADFSRQLKLLAKEFQVPVIALSQLNRQSEGQMGRARPQMSQLRESGAIEQDADVVILLHREYDDQGNLNNTEIILDVAKNRHGRTGFVTLGFDGAHSRIFDAYSTDA